MQLPSHSDANTLHKNSEAKPKNIVLVPNSHSKHYNTTFILHKKDNQTKPSIPITEEDKLIVRYYNNFLTLERRK